MNLESNESDPNSADYLKIEISDALNEKDKVKFTVKTKTTIQAFKETEFSVIREHEEFVWLHDRFVENEEFAGFIVRHLTHSQFLKPLITNIYAMGWVYRMYIM